MTAAAERAEPAADLAARRRGPAEPAPDRTPGPCAGSAPGPTEVVATARQVRRPATSMNPRSMAMLQRTAGNAAVAGLVRARRGAEAPVSATTGAGPAESSPADTAEVPVQRLAPGAVGGSTAPPVPPPAADPASDPKFRAVAGAVRSAGTALRKHPPAAAEVGKAQAAAKGPPDDKAGQAKAAQADAMAAAKPGGFDKAAFITAVRKAIADAAPKNLDDADKFAESGKADGVKSQVMSQVTTGRDTSVRGVRDATARTPDASAGKDKPVTPLAPEPAAATPPVDGAAAMPGPAPAEQVNFAGGPAQVDQQMADAQVTEQHLAKSNEPQLQDAATAKKGAEAHAAAAPAAIRAHESAALGEAKAGAGAGATAAMAGMGRDKAGALARVAGAKTDTKSKDEVERARISGEINKIFDQTKADVEVILNGIDGKVTAEFDKGEGAARSAFTAKHKADMEKYKDDRYSGVTGAARWTADLFTGLPAEANKIYDAAKALYESQMTVVISTVADLIGRELDAAKARVEKGRAQIKSFIASQPAALQKLAGEAAKDVGGKFDQLDADVDAKQKSLVDDLAGKYVEAKGKVDEEIKAEQEKNKGLVDKAKEAIGGAIDTILKLKALFTGLLAKAASAFTKILEDPVAFISNFMSAVKQGFLSFAGNILTHLKKGLLGWLFGALASAGIELPDSFDVKGILKLVGSILGLTWTNIKARIGKLAPWAAAAIDVIESKIEIFTILATQGIGGLWNWIKEKLGDLKSLILTPIMDFVKEKIITAGISWVIGMLNPAGALVKIVQALVGVVQWIMERGAALMDFVGTVIDSVTDIANGGVGGVPAKIEAALGKAVPLVIAFLANLLGLGGISDKIKSILKAVQAPINKALDAVIKGALKVAAPLIKGIKGLGAKAKAKIAAGKAWVKGKVEAGKQWVRDKASGRAKSSPAERKAAIDAAMAKGQDVVTNPRLDLKSIRAKLASIKSTFKVRRLELVVDDRTPTQETVHVVGANSPTVHGQSVIRPTNILQRSDDGSEFLAAGAKTTVKHEGIDVGVWDVGGSRVRVSFDVGDPGATLATGATPARALMDIMNGLKMDQVEAKGLVAALTAAGVLRSAAEARTLLHQYARTKTSGGLDPKAFLADKLRRGAGTAAAFARPPAHERRQAGVELGQTDEGKQRATLSQFAHVFYEKEVGDWKSRQVQPRPEQGENTSIEYIWQKAGEAVVESLGVVEVDEDGFVIDIVQVNPRNVPGGNKQLLEIMRAANWSVDLTRKSGESTNR